MGYQEVILRQSNSGSNNTRCMISSFVFDKWQTTVWMLSDTWAEEPMLVEPTILSRAPTMVGGDLQ